MWEMRTFPLPMDRILSGNIRGVNSLKKQIEVMAFIMKHVVGLVSLLETKVKSRLVSCIKKCLVVDRCFSSSTSYHPNGRIMLAWKPEVF